MSKSERNLWLAICLGLLGISTGACAGESSLSRSHSPGSAEHERELQVYDDSDLRVISKRGVELYAMEKSIEIAYRDGLAQAGRTHAASLLPLAGVDPGIRSGEVVFYRWFAELSREQLRDPEQARKWLVVPLLLNPDRLLAIETVDEPVVAKTETYYRLAAVLSSAKIALERYPGGIWHFHTFRELSPEKRRLSQTRVYLLGRSETSPDLELLIPDDLETSAIDAETAKLVVTLLSPNGADETIQMETDVPSPSTVARILDQAADSKMWANVVAKDGKDWRIHRKSGTLQRSSTHLPANMEKHD